MAKRRMEIEKFFERGVYLLKNGTFILVTGITPYNKFHTEDEERVMYYLEGECKESGSFNADDVSASYGEGKLNVDIYFDTSDREQSTIAEMTLLMATFVGMMNEETYNKITSNVY